MAAELGYCNGVISILVCSLVMAHFNFYNLSNTGQVCSKILLETIGTLCEAIIYLYLGISMWEYKGDGTAYSNELNIVYIKNTRILLYAWSWTFVMLEIAIMIVARTISIITPSLLVKM